MPDWCGAGPSGPCHAHAPCPLPAFCLENFTQRISLIKEMHKQRKTVKGGQIIIMYSLSIVKDCTHKKSCHNSEDWPQRNGNKWTLEQKTNYTWNDQDDTDQTGEQYEDGCGSWLLFLRVAPSFCYTSCSPLVARGGSWALDRCQSSSPLPYPHPSAVASIWKKAKFPFHLTGLFVGKQLHPTHFFGNSFMTQNELLPLPKGTGSQQLVISS